MVSNALDPPPDEGIRKCAHELAALLSGDGVGIFSVGRDAGFAARKALLSPRMLRALRAQRVDAVVYLPTQSATAGSHLRSVLLRRLTRARVVMVALQPRTVSPRLAARVGPDLLLTPSAKLLAQAREAGTPASLLELGVDVERFQPVDAERKRELRHRHGLPTDRPVGLHVGHARRLRGVEWLTRLSADLLPTVVVGSSLGVDRDVVESLRAAGARVIDHFIPDIHELYQLADVYLFPVTDEQSAISTPLSVLEAMACNVPVVTTPFGALPRMFASGPGLMFAESQAEFADAVRTTLRTVPDHVDIRGQVTAYSWRATAESILRSVEDLCRPT